MQPELGTHQPAEYSFLQPGDERAAGCSADHRPLELPHAVADAAGGRHRGSDTVIRVPSLPRLPPGHPANDGRILIRSIFFQDGDGQDRDPGAMMNHFSFDHVFIQAFSPWVRSFTGWPPKRLVPVTLELVVKPAWWKAIRISSSCRRIVQKSSAMPRQMCAWPGLCTCACRHQRETGGAQKTVAGWMESNRKKVIITARSSTKTIPARLIGLPGPGTIVHGENR